MTPDYKIPLSVLVVTHTPALRVLLIERSDVSGFGQLVTGSKDHLDESFVAVAVREVLEETSIDARPGQPLFAALCDWHMENVYDIYPAAPLRARGCAQHRALAEPLRAQGHRGSVKSTRTHRPAALPRSGPGLFFTLQRRSHFGFAAALPTKLVPLGHNPGMTSPGTAPSPSLQNPLCAVACWPIGWATKQVLQPITRAMNNPCFCRGVPRCDARFCSPSQATWAQPMPHAKQRHNKPATQGQHRKWHRPNGNWHH
jgi:8-oxo-dGTP pyrophosphatase MutT (NUDIX family)